MKIYRLQLTEMDADHAVARSMVILKKSKEMRVNKKGTTVPDLAIEGTKWSPYKYLL